MSHLLHNFLSIHTSQAESWIHTPTLRVNEEPLDFLAAIIAAGAVNSSAPELQRLGFALQEAVRQSIASSVSDICLVLGSC